MSFEIFVQFFRDGETCACDAQIVEELFNPLIEERNKFGWKLKPGGFVYIKDVPWIDGFMVARPPIDADFEQALLQLLRQTPAILYWPGRATNAYVANADVLAHLPKSLIDATHPIVVNSFAEIAAAIEKS